MIAPLLLFSLAVATGQAEAGSLVCRVDLASLHVCIERDLTRTRAGLGAARPESLQHEPSRRHALRCARVHREMCGANPGTSHASGTRFYYAWFPRAFFSSSQEVPLLLTFHGLNDNCLRFGHETGFIDVAEEANFIYVYPCATVGPLGIAWNAVGLGEGAHAERPC
jgi:hypothetical protein